MKQILEEFLKVFSEVKTDEQLAAYQEVKNHFKKLLAEKGEKTEKELMYLKDVYKSEFKE